MSAPNGWTRAFAAAGCLLAVAASCPAAEDVVELRAGGIVRGRYAGGTAETIRLETAQGVKVLTRQEVLAVTLAVPVAPPPAAPPAAAPPPPPQPQAVTLPAGSLLVVSVQTPVSSKDKPGKVFQAVLVADVAGATGGVVRAGTPVLGRVVEAKQAGRMVGKSTLELGLTELNINGRLVPVVTSSFAEAGKGSFRKTARNVAVGSVVGAAVADDGAGKGAAVGAGASLIREGDTVSVPPKAVLEFRLVQPVTIAPAP